MGTIVAQELAIAYPETVKSLTLVSVAPFAEVSFGLVPEDRVLIRSRYRKPEGVNEGRKEVFDLWRQLDESKDASFLEDIVFGAMQLLFHNHVNNQASACVWVCYKDVTLKSYPAYVIRSSSKASGTGWARKTTSSRRATPT